MQRFLTSFGYYFRKKKPQLDWHLKSQASRNNTLLQEEILRSISNWKKNSNIPVGEDEINEDQLDDEAVSNVFENLFGEQY